MYNRLNPITLLRQMGAAFKHVLSHSTRVMKCDNII